MIFPHVLEAFENKKYDEALELCFKALENNEKDIQIYTYMSICYFYLGKMELASQALLDALQLGKQNSDHSPLLTEVVTMLGKYLLTNIDLLEVNISDDEELPLPPSPSMLYREQPSDENKQKVKFTLKDYENFPSIHDGGDNSFSTKHQKFQKFGLRDSFNKPIKEIIKDSLDLTSTLLASIVKKTPKVQATDNQGKEVEDLWLPFPEFLPLDPALIKLSSPIPRSKDSLFKLSSSDEKQLPKVNFTQKDFENFPDITDFNNNSRQYHMPTPPPLVYSMPPINHHQPNLKNLPRTNLMINQ